MCVILGIYKLDKVRSSWGRMIKNIMVLKRSDRVRITTIKLD